MRQVMWGRKGPLTITHEGETRWPCVSGVVVEIFKGDGVPPT